MITELKKLSRDRQVYAASFAQKRMWFLSRLNAEHSPYQVPLTIAFDNHFDLNLLTDCLNSLIKKYEILRTTFKEEGGEVVQVIHEIVNLDLETISLPIGKNNWLMSEDYLNKYLLHHFNLEQGPLFITRIIKLIDSTILLMVFHHVIIDEWSTSLLAQEISCFYKNGTLITNENEPQYVDYANWQAQLIDNGILDKQFSFWSDKFKTIPDPLELPYDFIRAKNTNFSGRAIHFKISCEIQNRLSVIASNNRCTLFIVLLAVYQILLMRYTGQEDISIGVPVANRRHPALNKMLGLFVNTVVLRQTLLPQSSFLTHLQNTREASLDIFDNQDAPFEKVLQLLKLTRIGNYSPLFQVFFNYSSQPDKVLHIAQTDAEIVEMPILTARFDLSLYIKNNAGVLDCFFEYSTELFSEETIAAMTNHFSELIKHIVESPQTVISRLKMMTEQELLACDEG